MHVAVGVQRPQGVPTLISISKTVLSNKVITGAQSFYQQLLVVLKSLSVLLYIPDS